jgi:hypothetical protein
MTETIVLLKIVHSKPLPKLTTDTLAQRAYSFFYSQGCEAGVTATLVQVPKELGDGQPA